tara:strand:+ start:506 stop:670 length:165 start_codon:yes stop_codon:yes gene_type:complete
MNEDKLKETLRFYGISLKEYFLGCSVSDEEFYSRYGMGDGYRTQKQQSLTQVNK